MSPVSLASTKSDERPSGPQVFASSFRAGAQEAFGVLSRPWIEPAIDDSDAGVIEIDWLFHQKIAGLRRLPKHERPHALRAARDIRQAALKALRARRAVQRAANDLLRQQQKGPAPR